MNKEQEITDRLLHHIQSDAMALGQSLPPERQLASMFATSRNTVRGAIRKLEARGLLEIRKGSGTYLVSKSDRLGPWQVIGQPLSTDHLERLFEARRLFEPAIAGHAALRIDTQMIDALERCLVRFSKAFVANAQRFIAEEDAEFRNIIASGSGNPFFVSIMQQFTAANMTVFRHLQRLDDETRDRLFADYVDIINALKRHDATATERGVAQNIQHQYRILERYHGDGSPGHTAAMPLPHGST